MLYFASSLPHFIYFRVLRVALYFKARLPRALSFVTREVGHTGAVLVAFLLISYRCAAPRRAAVASTQYQHRAGIKRIANGRNSRRYKDWTLSPFLQVIVSQRESENGTLIKPRFNSLLVIIVRAKQSLWIFRRRSNYANNIGPIALNC